MEYLKTSEELSRLMAKLASHRFSASAIYSYLRLRGKPVKSLGQVYYHVYAHEGSIAAARNDIHAVASVHREIKRELREEQPPKRMLKLA